PAIGIDIDMPAEAAHRLPDQDKSESVSSHSPGLGFRRGAEVEERVDVLARDPGAGVGDGDDELPVGGDEVRPYVFLLRVRDRVEGIVEKVPCDGDEVAGVESFGRDRKSTRLNSSHVSISYAVFCLKEKKSRIPVGHAPAT